jgi:D-alanyl-D-alanine carboxypeptidase/D-alanyl-D-alanine-endopeptidase (penicillin-binding protein 4)
VTDEPPPSRRAAREAESARPRKVAREKAVKAPREKAAPAEPVLDENGNPVKVPGGIMAAIRKHPAAWLFSAGAVLFVLLGTGAIFSGVAFASTPQTTPSAVATEAPRPQPTATTASTKLRTCSVTPLAVDPRLMALYGEVRRADTGEVLYENNGSEAARTGSVLKVLTASAAVLVLGADFQISTQVVAGSTPGTVVLVGHGDPTLSAMPPGTESVYAGAPKLASLAAATIAAYKATYGNSTPITNLVLDATYWNSADKWDATWKRSEQTIGYHSEVTALQVDGDRADPTKQTSPRSTDPIGRAGQAFLQALRDADSDNIVAHNVSVSTGAANGGAVLGEVKSQPLRVLIKQMLLNSDNTLAEMIARITSVQSDLGGSAASLQQSLPSALWPEDPTTASQVVIKDGSGLSEANGVPAAVMSDFLRRVMTGADNLDVVRDALPVAGKTGTLSSRFSGGNAVARGHVTAKTGWIDTAYTLAGFMDAADGTQLTFAFYAVGDGIKDNAKEALDTLTTGVYTCGDNLANF